MLPYLKGSRRKALGGELAIAARNLELIGEASDDALREEIDQLETLAELSELLRADS